MQIVSMKFNHVKYLGNNCSSSLSVEATLNEKDSPAECFKTLESFVMNNLNDKPVSSQVAEALELANKPMESNEVKAPKEEPKQEGVNNEKDNSKESNSESSTKESNSEVCEEKSSPQKEVKPKKPKAPKNVNVAYDRNNLNHKRDFSQLVDGLVKGWKTDKALIDKVKVVSVQLEGKDMYQPDGKIVESFVEAIREGMNLESPIKA